MGLTYSDLQMMGSLYVFDTLSSLPIAPIECPASTSCVNDSNASCSWISLIKIYLSSRKSDKMGPLTMFQRLVRDWRDKMSPQDISTKVKVGSSTAFLILYVDCPLNSDFSTTTPWIAIKWALWHLHTMFVAFPSRFLLMRNLWLIRIWVLTTHDRRKATDRTTISTITDSLCTRPFTRAGPQNGLTLSQRRSKPEKSRKREDQVPSLVFLYTRVMGK